MPELPEVETIRRFLKPKIVGKKIKSIKILEKKQFIGPVNEALNKKIQDVTRVGKVLTLVLEKDLTLNIHFKLSGQLLLAADAKNARFKNIIPRAGTDLMPGRTTRIIIYFADDSALFFNDLRKFGWIKLDHIDKKHVLGTDILAKEFTLEYFRKCFANVKKPIKSFLLDQDKFAGIGNIYANEALFEARINPRRKVDELTTAETEELYRAVKKIIKQGVEKYGSSASDELYVLPDGSKGKFQYLLKVYHQEGKPCRRCRTPIERIKHGGRSSFFCPNCQPI